MAGRGVRGLNEALRGLSLSSHACRDAASHRLPSASPSTFTRSMATEAPLPSFTTSVDQAAPHSAGIYRPNPFVPVTVFNFPSFEPQRLEAWSVKHLDVPLRRDILHLAVVYEGDNTRQGTASSKTRFEVRGSHRKLHPQKGLGRARVGSKQSPLRKGGGKVFGPKPRDFGTKLNRKVYDLAWRTALSYRYRRGELIVCQDGMELPMPEQFLTMMASGAMEKELETSFRMKWVRQMLERNEWGKQHGRSTFITGTRRDELFDSLDLVPNWGRALDIEDVDVKDLLETGRLIVERSALKELIESHQSDLVTKVWINGVRPQPIESGKIIVE